MIKIWFLLFMSLFMTSLSGFHRQLSLILSGNSSAFYRILWLIKNDNYRWTSKFPLNGKQLLNSSKKLGRQPVVSVTCQNHMVLSLEDYSGHCFWILQEINFYYDNRSIIMDRPADALARLSSGHKILCMHLDPDAFVDMCRCSTFGRNMVRFFLQTNSDSNLLI